MFDKHMAESACEAVHIVAVTETHQRGEQIERAARKVERLGYSAYFAEATPSGAGGLQGGVACFVDIRVPSSLWATTSPSSKEAEKP